MNDQLLLTVIVTAVITAVVKELVPVGFKFSGRVLQSAKHFKSIVWCGIKLAYFTSMWTVSFGLIYKATLDNSPCTVRIAAFLVLCGVNMLIHLPISAVQLWEFLQAVKAHKVRKSASEGDVMGLQGEDG